MRAISFNRSSNRSSESSASASRAASRNFSTWDFFFAMAECKPRKPLENINPRDIFLQGASFYLLVQLIERTPITQDEGMEIVLPVIVNSAFNSELFLKCIICIETGKVPAIHELDKLFDLLSAPIRQRLIHKWDTEVVPLRDPMWGAAETQPNATHERDLTVLVRIASRAFEKVRYSYEPTAPAQFYLSDLPTILFGVILEMKPEWNFRRTTDLAKMRGARVIRVPRRDHSPPQGSSNRRSFVRRFLSRLESWMPPWLFPRSRKAGDQGGNDR